MSRQDKATTERNTRTLREFVKRPENKVCADCKKNDPRWASWNIGVYLCIRCSGIHRGMGTHISRVKSIDLDTWTPEQMQSIEKWGNRRANLYWEAHLKAGHVPPDHKMESFIRSKYETRRWALDGPPPSDPSVLEDGSSVPESAPPAPPQETAAPRAGGSRSTASPPPATRQLQPHQLLSTAVAADRRGQQAPPVAHPTKEQPQVQQPQAKQLEPENDLFSLDFHAPPVSSPTTSQQPSRKDAKQDILSLFSTPATNQPPTMSHNNTFGQFQSPTSAWHSAPTQPQQPVQVTSMIGTSGVGAWGTSSGWNPPAPAQGNLWGNPAPATTLAQPKQPDLFGGDLWGGSPNAMGGSTVWGSTGTSATAAPTTKKDDAFGDIWGDFK